MQQIPQDPEKFHGKPQMIGAEKFHDAQGRNENHMVTVSPEFQFTRRDNSFWRQRYGGPHWAVPGSIKCWLEGWEESAEHQCGFSDYQTIPYYPHQTWFSVGELRHATCQSKSILLVPVEKRCAPGTVWYTKLLWARADFHRNCGGFQWFALLSRDKPLGTLTTLVPSQDKHKLFVGSLPCGTWCYSHEGPHVLITNWGLFPHFLLNIEILNIS